MPSDDDSSGTSRIQYAAVFDMVATVVWASVAVAALLRNEVVLAFAFIAVASVFGRMATNSTDHASTDSDHSGGEDDDG